MATFHPGEIEPERERGERRVWRALASLDDAWHVFPHVHIRTDNPRKPDRELDFALLNPDFGLIGLEVKDGQIRIADGRFEQRQRTGWQRIDPVEQVKDGIYALQRYLRPSRLKVRFAVVFPDIDEPARPYAPGLPAGSVWTRNQLTDLPDAMRQLLGGQRMKTRLGNGEMQRLVAEIAPTQRFTSAPVDPSPAVAEIRRLEEDLRQRIDDLVVGRLEAVTGEAVTTILKDGARLRDELLIDAWTEAGTRAEKDLLALVEAESDRVRPVLVEEAEAAGRLVVIGLRQELLDQITRKTTEIAREEARLLTAAMLAAHVPAAVESLEQATAPESPPENSLPVLFRAQSQLVGSHPTLTSDVAGDADNALNGLAIAVAAATTEGARAELAAAAESSVPELAARAADLAPLALEAARHRGAVVLAQQLRRVESQLIIRIEDAAGAAVGRVLPADTQASASAARPVERPTSQTRHPKRLLAAAVVVLALLAVGQPTARFLQGAAVGRDSSDAEESSLGTGPTSTAVPSSTATTTTTEAGPGAGKDTEAGDGRILPGDGSSATTGSTDTSRATTTTTRPTTTTTKRSTTPSTLYRSVEPAPDLTVALLSQSDTRAVATTLGDDGQRWHEDSGYGRDALNPPLCQSNGSLGSRYDYDEFAKLDGRAFSASVGGVGVSTTVVGTVIWLPGDGAEQLMSDILTGTADCSPWMQFGGTDARLAARQVLSLGDQSVAVLVEDAEGSVHRFEYLTFVRVGTAIAVTSVLNYGDSEVLRSHLGRYSEALAPVTERLLRNLVGS